MIYSKYYTSTWSSPKSNNWPNLDGMNEFDGNQQTGFEPEPPRPFALACGLAGWLFTAFRRVFSVF